jgi:DNA-binding response OmpR family regulator
VSRLEPDETIIVVEDERDIATFLRAFFRASGREVVHLDPASAAEVAEAVAEAEPVCVLLDLNLRGFNGLDAYRLLREQGSTMPVIVVTADPNPRTKKAALSEGVTAFVQKPFGMKELYNLVEEVIADR